MLSHLLVSQCNIPYNILLVNLLRCGVLHSTKAVLTTVLPVGNIIFVISCPSSIWRWDCTSHCTTNYRNLDVLLCVCFFFLVHCLNCFRFRCLNETHFPLVSECILLWKSHNWMPVEGVWESLWFFAPLLHPLSPRLAWWEPWLFLGVEVHLCLL